MRAQLRFVRVHRGTDLDDHACALGISECDRACELKQTIADHWTHQLFAKLRGVVQRPAQRRARRQIRQVHAHVILRQRHTPTTGHVEQHAQRVAVFERQYALARGTFAFPHRAQHGAPNEVIVAFTLGRFGEDRGLRHVADGLAIETHAGAQRTARMARPLLHQHRGLTAGARKRIQPPRRGRPIALRAQHADGAVQLSALSRRQHVTSAARAHELCNRDGAQARSVQALALRHRAPQRTQN